MFILATVVKALINVLAIRLAGHAWEQSVLAGITMGQIGEFAFVIASTGLAAGAIELEGYKISVAVIALSLMLGPVWVAVEKRLRAAEDLGGRLSRLEFLVMKNIENMLGLIIERLLVSISSFQWLSDRMLRRITGKTRYFWPRRRSISNRKNDC